MPFKLNIFLTDKEYYDFNYLVMTRLKTGKRMILILRILFVVCFLIISATSIYASGLNDETVNTLIGNGIFFLLCELLLIPLFRLLLKIQVRDLKKHGKMPYSQNSVMEFDEEHFIETTDTNKTEHPYAAIEKICVVGEKYIYIFITSVRGYIIPSHSFNSPNQRDEFLEFLKGKCSEIRFYKK